ncbi:hypothetical protein ACFQJ7_11970 [Halovenus rubra]|uniref:HVO-0234-like beta-propeller domain-containing protein n=2 Tax=Halovenus rubra TaxID=869890 RepID=A0ABD5XA04_9EURY|nr:hypothetical protein [Halovenus rubra]
MAGPDTEDETDGDNATDERSLFEERYGETIIYVASEIGVVRVAVSRARVGEYGLIKRCTATDIATDDGGVVVGSEEDIFAGTVEADSFTALGFGSKAAVGFDDDTVYAARADGRVSRLEDVSLGESLEKTDWEQSGAVAGPSEFDGSLLAADDGVFRVGLEAKQVGDLSDVTTVARGPEEGCQLLAGTTNGLYEYVDDWKQVRSCPVRTVLTDGNRSWVLTESSEILRRDGQMWTELDTPNTEHIVDIARGESLYAVTEAGELLVAASADMTSDGHEGWHSQRIGARGIRALSTLA